MNTTELIALSMGAAWASGLNLYAAVFVLGFLGATGNVQLPAELQMLTHPLVLTAAGFLYVVEFFADKTPGLDTVWDAISTFVRVPAGAVLAAAAVGEVGPAAQFAAGLVGGGLSAATHATKAGTRVVINTSPEPVSNWAASVTEDAAVVGGLWAALHHPWLFLALLGVFILVVAWALPRLWRAVRSVPGRLRRLFARDDRVRPGAGGEEQRTEVVQEPESGLGRPQPAGLGGHEAPRPGLGEGAGGGRKGQPGTLRE